MGDEQNNPIAPYDGSIQEISKCAKALIEAGNGHLEPWRLDRVTKALARGVKRLAKAEAKGKKLATDAEVYRIMHIAEAESAAEKINALGRFKIRQWDREQRNKAAVFQEAFEYLPNSEPETPVDPDWLNSFFRASENVSDRQMRTLLAKLLAGEVAQPGSFSRRTLSAVEDMGTSEAKLLKKACSVIWFLEPPHAGAFIPSFVAGAFPQLLSMDDALTLDDIGLLHSQPGLAVRPPVGTILRYGSKRFTLTQNRDLGFPCFNATKTAQELYRLFETREYAGFLDETIARMKAIPWVLEPTS